MKRGVFGFVASLALAGAVLGAQNPPSTPPQNPTQPAMPQTPAQPARPQPADQAKDATLTGCLVQGSGPTVFILENAKLSTADKADKGKSFVVIAAASAINFRTDLNHQVSITGTPEDKTAPAPPAGEKAKEQDLPKLTAKSLTKVADTCSTQ